MTSTSTPNAPFRIDTDQSGPLLRAARPAMERALRFAALNDLYSRIRADKNIAAFEDRALDQLGITVDADPTALGRIPKTGPLVVVANHPFGGIEGMVLASLLRRVRPDVRLMANYMLSIIPDLRELFIFVDPFGSPRAARNNIAALRRAVHWVEDGGALGVFPAGEVSHLDLKRRVIADPPWSDQVARIIRRTGCAALPVFFDGRNSNLFQIMGMIHPRLRTLMLPRELFKRQGAQLSVRIGSVVTPQAMARYRDTEQITASLRLRTYCLRPGDAPIAIAPADSQPIAPPQPAPAIAAELIALPPQGHLLSRKEYDVFIGSADQLPITLQELGRLREIAFRLVGEGTGRPRDLDRFDPYYLHLVVWHRDDHQIAGAYRLGPTDRILPRFGKRGLYTSTLFRFKRKLLDQITPGLEMGRSFVHPDYQKSFAPLMLLWSGIGAYLALQPRYRYLFGPVSISADYSSMSKHLLMAFLKLHKSLPSVARWLRPRNPPKTSPMRDYDAAAFSRVVDDLDHVNDLVRQLEADGKPMPVLLRQYLTLNGVLLGFNVDPDFGDVLDGLLLVDVPNVDRKVLGRYMGRNAMQTYLQHHGASA